MGEGVEESDFHSLNKSIRRLSGVETEDRRPRIVRQVFSWFRLRSTGEKSELADVDQMSRNRSGSGHGRAHQGSSASAALTTFEVSV